MRIAAFLVCAAAFVTPEIAASAAIDALTPSDGQTDIKAFVSVNTVQELFNDFGLFGSWALNCKRPASPTNPHVAITALAPGVVVEQHDLGSDYALNQYAVVSAERLSRTRLSIDALFEPGSEREERQKLVFQIRNGTRRTIFNQPADGPVRVKDGIALGRGVKTPLLRKCE
jgi:hypothetical protein